MDTTTEWMDRNWKSLEQASRNITHGNPLAPDLLQHCLLDFLQKPNSPQICADGYAKFFIVRMMMNQWRSVTSPFYRIYRAHDNVSADQINLAEWYHQDAIEPDWDIDKVRTILDQMSEDQEQAGWYHVKLLELYSETPNFKRLAEMTKISRTSISKSVDRARKQIRQQYYG
jgi:DNA-directed RNA polymerase specialized sigma24 family protein